MAKVTIIKPNGECLETAPMQESEARDLYDSLAFKSEAIIALQFV